MTYERFEDLPVWKAAVALATRVFNLTEHACFPRKADLRNQLERAALSISNNIAEGFERGSTSELVAFLYIARGSAGETRSMLALTSQLGGTTEIADQLIELAKSAESVSRQLRVWAAKLQNSEIKGQRHLTDKKRKEFTDDRRAQAFIQQIKSEHEIRMQELLGKPDKAENQEPGEDQEPKRPSPK